MKRTTEGDIDLALESLNNAIKSQGVQVKRQGRYGYQGLDLYNLEGGCLNTVKTGLTTGQALDYVWAMIKGIDLYTYADR